MTVMVLYTDQNTINEYFKAPSGYIFEVYSITQSVITAGTNDISVRRVPHEDRVTRLNSFTDFSDMIFNSGTFSVGMLTQVVYKKPVRTKFLSICSRSTSTIAGHLHINYALVKATEEELIWEWVSHNRGS